MFLNEPGTYEKIRKIIIYDDILYAYQEHSDTNPFASIFAASPKSEGTEQYPSGTWARYVDVDIGQTDQFMNFARWNDGDDEYTYAIFKDHNVWRIKVSTEYSSLSKFSK